METLNASLHDSLTWSDTQFSDSEAQRLFSSAHFDVLVFVASKGGGSCPLQDRTPPGAPVDEQAVRTTTLEIRDEASFEAFFAVRPILSREAGDVSRLHGYYSSHGFVSYSRPTMPKRSARRSCECHHLLPARFGMFLIVLFFFPHVQSFLSQRHSWDRLSISRSAFEKLLSVCGVASDFCSFVRAFGSKVKDSDSNFNGYFRRVHEVEEVKADLRFSAYGMSIIHGRFQRWYASTNGRDRVLL